MAEQPESEEKSAALDSGKSPDSKAADDSPPPSEAGSVRLKLKRIANYAMHGFAPVVAILALVLAWVVFTGNQSGRAQINKADARIESLNASLLASQGELEKLKAAMAQEKAMQEEVHKKQGERTAKIIQGVTQLQIKMKIPPTLEERVDQPASASAVVPSAAHITAPAAAGAPTGAGNKPDAKIQSIKEAIQKFNKK